MSSMFPLHYICYPYFCYWITTNQIDHLVKRGSIKGVIFFSCRSCRKSKKRWLISGPPIVKGLNIAQEIHICTKAMWILTFWHLASTITCFQAFMDLLVEFKQIIIQKMSNWVDICSRQVYDQVRKHFLKLILHQNSIYYHLDRNKLSVIIGQTKQKILEM